MEYTQYTNQDTCRFSMRGDFTFDDHIKFKDIIDYVKLGHSRMIELDVSQVNIVDSAGMGLFLVAIEHAQKRSIRITFLNPQDRLAQMLSTGKTAKIFNVVH